MTSPSNARAGPARRDQLTASTNYSFTWKIRIHTTDPVTHESSLSCCSLPFISLLYQLEARRRRSRRGTERQPLPRLNGARNHTTRPPRYYSLALRSLLHLPCLLNPLSAPAWVICHSSSFYPLHSPLSPPIPASYHRSALLIGFYHGLLSRSARASPGSIFGIQ